MNKAITGIRKRGNGYEVKITRAILRDQVGLENKTYTFTVTSKADAMAKREAICADLDAGIIPRAIVEYAKQNNALQVTVGKMYRIMKLDPNYHAGESTERMISFLLTEFENVSLADFDKTALLAWIDSLRAKNNSPGTIRKKVGALRSIFTYAVQADGSGITSNVFDYLPKHYSYHRNHLNKRDASVKRDVSRFRRLNPGEYEAIMTAIDDYRLDPRREVLGAEFKPALKLLVDIAIDTAMRLQEIFLLQFNHIDFDARKINVIAANTKVSKAREIPITKALLPKLKNYKKQFDKNNAEYVLPFFPYYDCNRENCSVALSHMWRRLMAFASIENLRFHDLRHEGVSRMVERTSLSLPQLQKISGHADSRTFERYNEMRATEQVIDKFY